MTFHTAIARLREASYAAPSAGEDPNTCRVGRHDLRTALHVIDRLDADLRRVGVISHGAVHPASEAVRDAAFEAVRKQLCKLPRYSFFAGTALGSVRRVEDRSGNWIEFDAAHALFDPVRVDAALSEEEQQAARDIVRLCREIAEDFGEQGEEHGNV